jgi:hypothetical protein
LSASQHHNLHLLVGSGNVRMMFRMMGLTPCELHS